MANRRIARVNEQLKRELSELLRFEVSDPRLSGATVTAVTTSSDLDLARVFLGTIGDVDTDELIEGANSASAFLRGALAKRMNLRHMPELRFELDRSYEHGMRIERILSEVLPDDAESGDGEEG